MIGQGLRKRAASINDSSCVRSPISAIATVEIETRKDSIERFRPACARMSMRVALHRIPKVLGVFQVSDEYWAHRDEKRLQFWIPGARNQYIVNGFEHLPMIGDFVPDIGSIELRS